jgi:hypothetical protein
MMNEKCANPYCEDENREIRKPTAEELESLLAELDEEAAQQLKNEEVDIAVCTSCGAWTATRWDAEKGKTVRSLMPSPFIFDLGAQVTVTLPGDHLGKVGKIRRRARTAKAIMPIPPPDNTYWIVFEEGGEEFGYVEESLERAEL